MVLFRDGVYIQVITTVLHSAFLGPLIGAITIRRLQGARYESTYYNKHDDLGAGIGNITVAGRRG